MVKVVVSIIVTSGNSICNEFYVNDKLIYSDSWCDYNQTMGGRDYVYEFNTLEEAIDFLVNQGISKERVLKALKI